MGYQRPNPKGAHPLTTTRRGFSCNIYRNPQNSLQTLVQHRIKSGLTENLIRLAIRAAIQETEFLTQHYKPYMLQLSFELYSSNMIDCIS